MGELWRRFLTILKVRQFNRELEEEMLFHLDSATGDQQRDGVPPKDAAQAARRRFGNVALIQETSREPWGIAFFEKLLQDLRYAARMLRKSPGFTLPAILSLALGIGANTAIFTVIYAVMMRSIPVDRPEQLRLIGQRFQDREILSFPYPGYQMARDQNPNLSVIAFDLARRALRSTGTQEPEPVARQFVSGNFFSMLGVFPSLGRVINAEDDKIAGGHPVAVLSHAYWQRAFGSDPSAIGKGITIDEVPYTIVGVASQHFSGIDPGRATDVWVPALMWNRNCVTSINCQFFHIMARLGPGVSDAQATAALEIPLHRLLEERTRPMKNEKDRREILSRRTYLMSASAGDSLLARQFGTSLTLLMAIVGLVLLLACANLANLLLARSAARKREIGVRLAIGAARGRLIRQLLTESIFLASLGGIAGLLLAPVGGRALQSLLPRTGITVQLDLTPDFNVLLFTTVVSITAGLLFGLAPALRSTRADVAPSLKDTASQSGRDRSRIGRFLVVSQVALSMLLLVGAGLFVRTLSNVKTLDAGFRRDHVVVFQLSPPRAWKPPQAAAATDRLLAAVRALPTVVAAGSAQPGPLTGGTWDERVTVDGYNARAEEDTTTNFMRVSAGYFESMGTPLLTGRSFTSQDVATANTVAVANESFVRSFFAGRNPLGARVTAGSVGPVEIVGVVRDARYIDLKEPAPRMLFFAGSPLGTFVARSSGDPTTLASAIRETARTTDGGLRVERVETMSDYENHTIVQERMIAKLSAVFGALALALAAIGLYGVMTYAVARRTSEIGIRLALGASRRDIVSMVFGETAWLLIAGVALGIAGTLASGRLITSMLFGLKPSDPGTIALCGVILTFVATLAAYVPARRAMRVDPIVALRYE